MSTLRRVASLAASTAAAALGAATLYGISQWRAQGAVSHDGLTYFVPHSRVQFGASPSASAQPGAAPATPPSRRA
jgi:hypothetical protein